MTLYEVRLDELGLATPDHCGGSTVLIGGGYDEKQSIHWGHASNRGESRPIVNVRIGFLSITLDERVIGKDKLKALNDRWKRKSDPMFAADTTSENRYDAAQAAMLAGDYELSVAIDHTVLTDVIVREALVQYAKYITPDGLIALAEGAFKAADDLRRESVQTGAENMQAALRKLLGISEYRGGGCVCGPQP